MLFMQRLIMTDFLLWATVHRYVVQSGRVHCDRLLQLVLATARLSASLGVSKGYTSCHTCMPHAALDA
eukprot:jgi/Chrzof1/7158/Cz02g13080.t1